MKALRRFFKWGDLASEPPRALTGAVYAVASRSLRESAHRAANAALSDAAAGVARVVRRADVDPDFLRCHVASVLNGKAPSVGGDRERAANRFINEFWDSINTVAAGLMLRQNLGDDEIRAIVADAVASQQDNVPAC